jgi:hypothetical protein
MAGRAAGRGTRSGISQKLMPDSARARFRGVRRQDKIMAINKGVLP